VLNTKLATRTAQVKSIPTSQFDKLTEMAQLRRATQIPSTYVDQFNESMVKKTKCCSVEDKYVQQAPIDHFKSSELLQKSKQSSQNITITLLDKTRDGLILISDEQFDLSVQQPPVIRI
jgi:hypothetical protein